MSHRSAQCALTGGVFFQQPCVRQASGKTVIIFLFTGRGENFYIEASSQRTNIKHQLGGNTMLQKLIGFFKDEEGATAVEYALFVALIAAVIVIVVQAIGERANEAFDKIEQAMPK